jgi:hypothetical protein
MMLVCDDAAAERFSDRYLQALMRHAGLMGEVILLRGTNALFDKLTFFYSRGGIHVRDVN